MKFALAFTLVLLCGCFRVGNQANQQTVPAQESPLARLTPGVSGGSVTQPESIPVKDIMASNNATQQSLTGFGIQVSKLAESFKLFGDSLAHVETKVESNVKASAELNTEVRNTLESKLEVHASNQMKLLSDFEAKIDSKITAQGAGMLGLKNDLQQLTQNVSAGRDSNVQTIQYSREMKETLIQAFETVLDLVKAFCAMMVSLWLALQITDRMRNRNDHREQMKALSLLAKNEGKP